MRAELSLRRSSTRSPFYLARAREVELPGSVARRRDDRAVLSSSVTSLADGVSAEGSGARP